jgi:peptidoglycan/LPS O-acetylase OafA/YrhL
VLSGFLIGGILLKTIEKNNGMNFKVGFNFLVRRWFRTIPNYLLFLVINLLYFYYIIDVNLLPTNVLKYFFFLQNFAWKRELFFGESWSLCVEEWFYILVPLCSIFFYKIFKNRVKDPVKAFLWIILFFLCSPLLLRLLSQHNESEFRLIVIYRLDSIMYGVLMAYFYFQKNKILKYKNIMAITGHFLILSLLIFLFFGKYQLDALPQFIFSVIPLSFCITLPFYQSLKKPNNKLLLVTVTKISLWSYSLYLVHLPVILSLRNIFAEFIAVGTFNVLVFRSFCLILSFCLAAFIYHYFEVPTTKLRNRFTLK